jgi:coenzyme F420-reducing hydrogenase delta subunit/heterodisulfide reductase subunit C
MKHQSKQTRTEAIIRIDDDHCSRCMICLSVCPFDALSTERESAKVNLDIEKCQVCGICFAACPASAIETIYYNVDPFLNYVSMAMREKGLNKLVLSCRGTGIPEKGMVMSSGKQHIDDSITVSLPCLGRVPSELLLKMLSIGIKKIVILPCEDKYCRFKDGSVIGTRRFLLIQALLNQLGFKPETLTTIKRSIKAHIDAYRCIGCGNCNYTCAYSAIKIEAPGVALVDPDACAGCGACEAVCPAFAVKLDRFEHEAISHEIRSYSSSIPKMKLQVDKPVILVLSCEWSEFSDLDSIQNHKIENVVFLELPCAGSVDALHILEAFYSGFDGVLIAACRKDECKLEKGNEKAEKRISSLKKLLAEISLEDRLEMCFVSPKNVGDLDMHIKLFAERINPSVKKKVVYK